MFNVDIKLCVFKEVFNVDIKLCVFKEVFNVIGQRQMIHHKAEQTNNMNQPWWLRAIISMSKSSGHCIPDKKIAVLKIKI